MMNNFVHLHLHSEYSLLDGAVRIDKLVERAKEYGMPAVAITDHGSMHGVVKFYKKALELGIKPIIGCEVYVAPRTRFDKEVRLDEHSFHLTLLAENNQGYQNLLELVTKGSIEGFYYRPRVDLDLLSQYSRGIIALSGCLSGQIPTLLLQRQWEEANKVLTTMMDIYGKDNFYLEIQNHGIEEQRIINPDLIRLSQTKGVPLVATNDVHYLDKGDAGVHEILLCIQTGKNISDPDRLRFRSDQLYFKSVTEMKDAFFHLPEAIDNTLIVADRCNVTLDFNSFHLPHFEVPTKEKPYEYLRRLCFDGARERYGNILSKEVIQRLEHELNIIEKMGFIPYFLIVHDFIRYAKKSGIPVGPGRGSAAGSLVAYSLGITNIDPLKYGLLFERFLNPERITMPDIDIDFCYVRRDEVIDYVVSKYGTDHVAQIITFGTMAAKAVVRDVGRVLELPYTKIDKIAKLIPGSPGMTIDKSLEVSPELKMLEKEDEDVARVIKVAKKLEGLPRHASTHAAGVVISKEPLTFYTPLIKNKNEIITQFDMEDLESIGLLKIDFLGLRTLTVIDDTVKMLQKKDIEVDIDRIPLDDKKTYRLLQEVKTAGIFQMESRLYQHLCKELQPENFNDIIAMMALGRPGALQSGMVDDYFLCRHGKKEIKYLHPSLEPILQETYGLILYQEQVMEIASRLAGYTLGEADILRRGMGKKKEELIQSHRERFLEGTARNNIPGDIANNIFNLMEYFGGYGFNKSHSAAYALVAYQTAYLKAHYPVEFMAATLTSVMGSSGKVAYYIEECRQMGIEVLPPDINQSGPDFTVVGPDQIRFGLAAVKNVGSGAIDEIVKGRIKGRYCSLTDLCNRIDSVKVNSKVLESLIRCGALDSLGGYRSQYLMILGNVLQKAQYAKKQEVKGQLSLSQNLDIYSKNQVNDELPEVPEYSKEEILRMEKELIGVYLTGHPLDPYQKRYEKWAKDKLKDLGEIEEDREVIVGGVVSEIKKHTTKRGQIMAFITIEDRTGNFDGVLFPQQYSKYQHLLAHDLPVLVIGKIEKRDEQVSLIIDKLLPLNQEFLVITLKSEEYNAEKLQKLGAGLLAHNGPRPVIMEIYNRGFITDFVVDERYWVREDEVILEVLESLVGKGNFYFI